MATNKPTKRFSLANLTRSFQTTKVSTPADTTTTTPPPSSSAAAAVLGHKNKRRPEKTQSLYIKPSSPPLTPSEASQAPRQSFQDELPKKSHTQHIKKTIRRSLSVIMYANPGNSSTQQDEKSHLVPVLVTPNVADPMMLMEKKTPAPIVSDSPPSSPSLPPVTKAVKKQPKRILEYDNTIIIEPLTRKSTEEANNKDSSDKEDILILWQGYGYTLEQQPSLSSSPSSSLPSSPLSPSSPLLSSSSSSSSSSLEQEPIEPRPSRPRLEAFDEDRWAGYQGLIHPLFLFDLDEQQCWDALTVAELRRYYDNYGSMMLKQREWRQQQQTLQYHPAAIMT
ncbi:hypothetical protein BCR42DRAFT_455727 [Absidia repens]|uniref:Uncharacterized protein n=1 Tax=Absidia repens TaxID=90262 RepID=A0A1X2I344_9FUNG|nr:hypothetical protein BCR42DRAFT_455727 [Absidia repens]